MADDRGEVEVHKLAKKERGQYPAILTEQTWSTTHTYLNQLVSSVLQMALKLFGAKGKQNTRVQTQGKQKL